jgi:hypothetical protein
LPNRTLDATRLRVGTCIVPCRTKHTGLESNCTAVSARCTVLAFTVTIVVPTRKAIECRCRRGGIGGGAGWSSRGSIGGSAGWGIGGGIRGIESGRICVCRSTGASSR